MPPLSIFETAPAISKLFSFHIVEEKLYVKDYNYHEIL